MLFLLIYVQDNSVLQNFQGYIEFYLPVNSIELIFLEKLKAA
jgi:hypothetical protein